MKFSKETYALCLAGPFEAEALVAYLPELAAEIAANGETEVVRRCQIARANCAGNAFAVECVKSYFARPLAARATSELCRRAMTPEEADAATLASMDAFAGAMRTAGPSSITVSVTNAPS
jgi:hypothetical protein